jgi:hypothetical protein
MVFLMHGHFDLKKSHFDSRNQVPDVMVKRARVVSYFCHFISHFASLQLFKCFRAQVQQAADSVRRAYKDGVTRQVVCFALFPEDEMLNEKERLWLGATRGTANVP